MDRGGDQEVLGKWTVCTTKMPKDRNAFTPSNLLALICGTVYYKTSKRIRYKCCTEYGIIQVTIGREQLDPFSHMDQNLSSACYFPKYLFHGRGSAIHYFMVLFNTY
jgi:hypothetical protein